MADSEERGKIPLSPAGPKPSLYRKSAVFILCFLCMAARHWTLESWAMTKKLTSSELKFSGAALGTLDTVYLSSYALGSYISGLLGDRYPRVRVVTVGLTIACAALWVAIASSVWHSASLWLFTLLWVFNGSGQSAVWTGTVAIMGNWFSKENRGSLFGFWSSNASAGNIIGSQMAGFMMSRNCSWESIMMTAVTGLFIVAVLFFLFVTDKPSNTTTTESTSILHNGDSSSSISFVQAWRIEGVAVYTASYSSLKLMNYGVMFWMPFYLSTGLELDGKVIGLLASLFDFGGVFGGMLFGHLSDRLSSRVLIVAPLVFASIPLLLVFLLVTESESFLLFLIVPLLGMTIITPTNLISSAVASDLSHKTEIEGNRKVLGTVTGIIDGTGSAAAACGMFLIGVLQDFSWTYVFLFLVANGLIATAFLFPETKKAWQISQSKNAPRVPSFGTEMEPTNRL